MREYLFHGKRVDNGEWVKGYYTYDESGQITENPTAYIYYLNTHPCGCSLIPFEVIPESVGQYTEMNEFVVSDRSFNQPLFEGDIVEVWSRRRPPTENIYNKPTSQYDIQVKARAVICFKYGKWFLDYDNKYNKSLCKLQGNEQYERTVNANHTLYDFGLHHSNEDWCREHHAKYKWNDIIKIGNVFDNAELLEG